MAETDKKVRVPPNSKESEMMVLGCMLTSINALNTAADLLEETDFYYLEHQTIFYTLKTAYRSDKPADIHLISEDLKRIGKLDAIGGISYLTTLAQYAGTSAYIEEYVTLVREKSILRRMVHAAQGIERTALEEPADVHAALDEAQSQFYQISQSSQNSLGISLKDLITGIKAESKMPFLKELQERQQKFLEKGPNEPGITGVPTHFTDLDKMLNGFMNSNFILLGARPAMGKTAMILNIAENICFRNKLPVGIFSLEMGASQLLHRLICSQAEVESQKIQTGALNGSEYQRVVGAANAMSKHTMIIDDQPGLKITDIRARARRMKEAYNIGFLAIDYLQLISGSGNHRSQESRQIEISEISRTLKTLARELNIPILCAAQLSRKVEERQGHRPMMSDLRESGCLTGDTLIKDAETGQLYTMKELADRSLQTPIKVFAVNENLKIGPHILSKAFYSGRKKVYALKTASGRSIKASANHPFLKLEGWTRLDQLKGGDRIGMPRSLNTSKESSLSTDELVFLGHLLGDGCILPRQPYHYTSADRKNLDIVSGAAARLFGIKPRLVPQKNWYHLYFPSPYRLTQGKYHPITLWFKKLDIERCRSYEKQIPKAVFSISEENRALFLHHLWATDGNISTKKGLGKKPSGNIYYTSSSKVLATQVQHLLLSIGIQSSMRTTSKKGYRLMYHVQVEGKPNQTQFLTKIGCAGMRGENIPALLQDLDCIETNPNKDVIPREAWNLFVKPAKDGASLSWRDVSKGLNMAYCGSSLFKSGISRKRMASLHEFVKDPSLHQFAASDIYWDEIISITELGEEDVYDATIPSVHNFVANDFIVHNSLEQDSDVVMFLFRRDYYDKHDKPGLAEMIISKNRHGGVGDVVLTFRKEIGQFANYTPMSAQPENARSGKDPFAAFSPEN